MQGEPDIFEGRYDFPQRATDRNGAPCPAHGGVNAFLNCRDGRATLQFEPYRETVGAPGELGNEYVGDAEPDASRCHTGAGVVGGLASVVDAAGEHWRQDDPIQ